MKLLRIFLWYEKLHSMSQGQGVGRLYEAIFSTIELGATRHITIWFQATAQSEGNHLARHLERKFIQFTTCLSYLTLPEVGYNLKIWSREIITSDVIHHGSMTNSSRQFHSSEPSSHTHEQGQILQRTFIFKATWLQNLLGGRHLTVARTGHAGLLPKSSSALPLWKCSITRSFFIMSPSSYDKRWR
jgi:hypothetical protein